MFELKDLLFRRYSNPIPFLATYSLEELSDVILSIFDKDREDEIWDTWLHKDEQNSFSDFKKKYFKQMRKDKQKVITKDEEKENIKHAMKFIRPINKGGEANE